MWDGPNGDAMVTEEADDLHSRSIRLRDAPSGVAMAEGCSIWGCHGDGGSGWSIRLRDVPSGVAMAEGCSTWGCHGDGGSGWSIRLGDAPSGVAIVTEEDRVSCCTGVSARRCDVMDEAVIGTITSSTQTEPERTPDNVLGSRQSQHTPQDSGSTALPECNYGVSSHLGLLSATLSYLDTYRSQECPGL
ncbi:hypothetical protein Bbelb_406080 [Branchiostoma belcheri]|nr:hypothetical protein Bbelb_406080 [Branchiostoma belcheri]